MNDPREPVVRLTRPSDINSVTFMDAQCYAYPIELKTWQEHIKGSGKDDEARIVVIEAYHKPMGFAMWKVEDNVGKLYRLGVLPKYRRRGLGSVLMRAFLRNCAEKVDDSGLPCCHEVNVVVPHIHCNTGDEDDVYQFLLHCGFKPTGEVLHDYRVMYGDDVDGYVFGRKTDEFRPLKT